MHSAIGIALSLLVAFVGGFAVGWSERGKDEVRKMARAFEKLRDKRALEAVRKHFATARD